MIPPLAPTFEAALRDVDAKQARFRHAAAERLADPPASHRKAAVTGLLSLGQDPDGMVRAAAFESLGILGAQEAALLLESAFDDPHPAARQAAVLAFGRSAPGSAERVASLLKDPRPEMRFSAVWTLSALGEEHAALVADALDDQDPEVRLLGAQCLGDLRAHDFVDRLADRLDDPGEAVRFAAASALAAMRDTRGAPVLRQGLSDRDRAFAAVIGLGDLADEASHAELGKLARGRFRSPILRAAAARALVRLGDPEGARVLRKMIGSWRIEARQYAVELVGDLGLSALLPDLRKAFARSRPRERAAYESALEQLAETSPEARSWLASIRETDHPD